MLEASPAPLELIRRDQWRGGLVLPRTPTNDRENACGALIQTKLSDNPCPNVSESVYPRKTTMEPVMKRLLFFFPLLMSVIRDGREVEGVVFLRDVRQTIVLRV